MKERCSLSETEVKEVLAALDIDGTLENITRIDRQVKKPGFAYETLDLACEKYWLTKRLDELQAKEIRKKRKEQ
jgi:hypothetical protein